MSKNTSGQVNIIVSHGRAHGEELWGATCVMKDTTGKFPGASFASVVTHSDDIELTKLMKCPDSIMIGTGAKFRHLCPDRVYDEHGEKHKRKCAADLVMEALGIENGPHAGVLAEFRKFDLGKHIAPMSLSTVLKVRYEYDAEANVIEWAMQGLSALYDLVEADAQLGIEPKVFIEVIRDEAKKVAESSKANQSWFTTLYDQFEAASLAKKPTDIGTIFYALRMVEPTMAERWLRVAVRNLCMNQVSFHSALQEFLKNRKEIEVQADFPHIACPGWSTAPVRIALIHTDSPQMHKVYRRKEAGGYEILIQRNRKGQVAIFTDEHLGLDMDALVRMVRFAEISASGRTPRNWWVLAASDTLPFVPEWFYFKEGRMLLNGSRTQPGVRPTKLTDEDFATLLRFAFTKSGVQAFMRKYGVLKPRKLEQQKQAKQPEKRAQPIQQVQPVEVTEPEVAEPTEMSAEPQAPAPVSLEEMIDPSVVISLDVAMDGGVRQNAQQA